MWSSGLRLMSKGVGVRVFRRVTIGRLPVQENLRALRDDRLADGGVPRRDAEEPDHRGLESQDLLEDRRGEAPVGPACPARTGCRPWRRRSRRAARWPLAREWNRRWRAGRP